ncbi:MAG: thioredoxin fold domain-containing protein [Burkholderiaceae bacterium]
MTLPASPHRRRAVVCLAAVGLTGSLGLRPVHAQGIETFLPTPASLREAASAAQSKGEPLVLLVSLPGCPWCELLRRNYLAPMRNEGVPAYQITVNDRKQVVEDFKSQRSSGADMAKAYQVKLTPSVLFLGADGAELAPRIEGVASVEMVGGLLDARLLAARTKLRASR